METNHSVTIRSATWNLRQGRFNALTDLTSSKVSLATQETNGIGSLFLSVSLSLSLSSSLRCIAIILKFSISNQPFRMQRFVDDVLAVTKESVKTFTYESLNIIVRLINGVSALVLALLPGKANILEGIQGWELRPTFRGPRFPRWMEKVPRATFADYGRQQTDWILIPLQFLMGLPFRLFQLVYSRVSKPRSISGCQHPSQPHSPNGVQSLKDQIIHRATDRRRGVIEDLHLAMEIFIEAVFDVIHKSIHVLFSPSEALGTLFRFFSSHERPILADNDVVEDASVSSAPAERNTSFRSSLNTDARTCQDVITELGYPYEAIRVITADGYVLLLERIPRRDARKVVYLQHGIFDSSMGYDIGITYRTEELFCLDFTLPPLFCTRFPPSESWISNGVVGSPAFAAYDQGFDVFLGNIRGLVSREHVNKNISSREYWKYSINEYGTKDIPALIEKIHQVKMAELRLSKPDIEEESNDDQLYKLCAICHSLGGAAMLMYVVTRRLKSKPHRLSRLVLLSPAGFHHDSSVLFSAVEHVLFFLGPILSRIFPAFYVPTRFFRMLVNKLARDLQHLPAVGGLVQTLVAYVAGGDSSNWVGVLGLPHYNMNDMPGVSFGVALHLAQMKRTRRFRMFDYGSAYNMKIYGSLEPLDLGEHYGLIDIPVDLVAGQRDTVIRSSMVKRHYKLMKDAGVDVSYNEFEYAHLDFTFSHREELLSYVMSSLLLVKPNSKKHQRAPRSRRKGHTSISG
ncbi:Triacylglycerol lipase [Vigna angularis]|uniref:Triacylglycerol lipase n=1 Tax=Phaseolus angularis TaxID=3914 RepID=A0A8T0LFC2_PHAAN|nr:Triacylglycerol lipase [Vigna angularis]